MTARKATVAEAKRLVTQRRFGDAEPILRALTAQRPRLAFGWFGLGLVALEAGAVRDAASFFREAVKRDERRASHHHNLALTLGMLGDFQEASTHFERAIALAPDYAEAYFNYANNATFSDSRLLDAIEARLAARRAAPAPTDRVFWHFAAGKIADDLGEVDRAFPHFAAGNAAKDVTFDRAAHTQSIDTTMASFPPDVVERLAGTGHPDARFVFVIGMPRSGTTLVEDILARHPAVHGAGERRDIGAIAAKLGQHRGGGAYPEAVPELDVATLRHLGAEYARRVGALAPNASRIVDKLPGNYRYLGLIALLLPNARFVHCRRDPVDTCFSCYKENFTRGHAYTFDLGDLAHVYTGYTRLMRFWRELFGERVLDVDYEELCREPERETRRILAHCGLDDDPGRLEAGGMARPVGTASVWQVRQPISTRSIGRAQPYRHHLGPLLDGLDDGPP